MTIDTWLRIAAIGLPLIGVLALRRWPDKFLSVPRWLAAAILGVSGVTALILFLLNKHYSCILVTGRGNCLVDGSAMLSLLLLNALLVRACMIQQVGNNKDDYILMLLLASAWAGVGLAENLLVLLIFLYLFFYVLHKWLERNGLRLRFLIVRDDYSDERTRYRDSRPNKGDRK